MIRYQKALWTNDIDSWDGGEAEIFVSSLDELVLYATSAWTTPASRALSYTFVTAGIIAVKIESSYVGGRIVLGATVDGSPITLAALAPLTTGYHYLVGVLPSGSVVSGISIIQESLPATGATLRIAGTYVGAGTPELLRASFSTTDSFAGKAASTVVSVVDSKLHLAFDGTDSLGTEATRLYASTMSTLRRMARSSGGTYCKVGDGGFIATSTDLETWTSRTSGVSTALHVVVWAEFLSLFIAFGASGKILTSPTGETWTSQTSGVVATLYGAAVDEEHGVVITAGSSGTILSSTNATSWTAQTSGVSSILYSVLYSAALDRWAICGYAGVMLTAEVADLTAWTSRTTGIGATRYLYAIAENASLGKILCVGSSSSVIVSDNLTSWTVVTISPATYTLSGCTSSAYGFHISGNSGVILKTDDPEDADAYVRVTINTAVTLGKIQYINRVLYALGANGTVLYEAATDDWRSIYPWGRSQVTLHITSANTITAIELYNGVSYEAMLYGVIGANEYICTADIPIGYGSLDIIINRGSGSANTCDISSMVAIQGDEITILSAWSCDLDGWDGDETTDDPLVSEDGELAITEDASGVRIESVMTASDPDIDISIDSDEDAYIGVFGIKADTSEEQIGPDIHIREGVNTHHLTSDGDYTGIVIKRTPDQYGIRFSLTSTSPAVERIAQAHNLESDYAVGNEAITDNDFDGVSPWKDIKLCAVAANGTVTYSDDPGFATDGSVGEVMVEIPKFYFRRYIEDGYEHWLICGTQLEDYEVDPAFIEGATERDYVYVACYAASVVSSKLTSRSETYPEGSLTISTFRTYAQAVGTGFGLLDYRTLCMLWKLFVIEHATRDSQSLYGGINKLPYRNNSDCYARRSSEGPVNYIYLPHGNSTHPAGIEVSVSDTIAYEHRVVESVVYDGGWKVTFSGDPVQITEGVTQCYSTPQQNGKTDEFVYHTTRDDSLATDWAAFRYRWMENLWGNIWPYIDGIALKNLEVYVGFDQSAYANSGFESTYEKFALPVPLSAVWGNFVKTMGWDAALPSILVPTEINATSGQTTYYCDAWYAKNDLATTIYNFVQGGGWDHETPAGLFCLRAWQIMGSSSWLYGARLQYKPVAPA